MLLDVSVNGGLVTCPWCNAREYTAWMDGWMMDTVDG